MSEWNGFRGAAKRLDDLDLPRIGATIGVGEDELHAFLEVESRGAGFDALGRPKILFEPHVFFRCLPQAKRAEAQRQGLAAPKWGALKYGKESEQHGKLERALAIDETAALKACSWGLTQVLGENHRMVGYDTVQDFVRAVMEDEENHLAACVEFIKASGIDDDLRAHRWEVVARVYNGPGYKKNAYDTRMAAAYKKWARIPDTPWSPEVEAPVAISPASTASSPAAPAQPKLGKFEIEAIQRRLRELGYYEVGKVDGLWGSRTSGALVAFQHDNGLTVDGVYGPRTKEAMATAKPRPIAPERLRTTIADLRAQGSETVRQADAITWPSGLAAWGGLILTILLFLAQNWEAAAGLAELGRPFLQWVPAWGWPLVVALAGLYLWGRGEAVKAARLRAERLGLHNGEPDPAPSPPVTQAPDVPGLGGFLSLDPAKRLFGLRGGQ